MILKIDATGKSDRPQLVGLAGAGEQHVHRRHPCLAGQRAGAVDQRAHGGGSIAAVGNQQPAAADRRERHAHDQLGIVVPAGPVNRFGPAPIAREIAVRAIALVGGRGGVQLPILPERQVARAPAVAGGRAARMLERLQPGPAQKRRGGGVDERIPGLARQVGDPIGYPQLGTAHPSIMPP